MKIFYRLSYINEENIPKTGAYIFCSNHVSNFDPVIIGSTNKREFYFLAKEELIKTPVIGIIFNHLNLIPIKRGMGDIGAIRKSIEALKSGKAMVMFPEGTRSKDGELKKGKDGVSLIAKKAECDIIPCAVSKKIKLFKKTKVIFGKPILISEYKNIDDLSILTERIMNEIKLLSEEI